MKNGDFPVRYVSHYQRVSTVSETASHDFTFTFFNAVIARQNLCDPVWQKFRSWWKFWASQRSHRGRGSWQWQLGDLGQKLGYFTYD